MKRFLRSLLLLTLVLCMGAGIALADTYYVKPDIESPLSLRDAATNDVLTVIPAGTALEPDGAKSTDLCAYVTYNGFSGLVLWNYLTRTAPGGGADPLTVTAPTPAPSAPAAPDVLTLRAVGAVIQTADSRNKAAGAEMAEMTVTPESNVIITAKIPRGRKIECWVFNGVRYDFLKSVKSLRMTAFDRSWTVEVVYQKTDALTLRSPAEIQAARTGQPLIAQVNNGELCHIKSGTKGGGGWITRFDFTADYTNRATGAAEQGGQLTAKIRAKVPNGKKVTGWLFDETEIYPIGANVTDFVVRTLDTSMTYEPIFGKKAGPTAPPTTVPPNPVVRYVTVTCSNCRFSGGGYSGATSGSVPVGTKITVTGNENSSENYWEINGSTSGPSGRTITRTINVNTTIHCMPVIN